MLSLNFLIEDILNRGMDVLLEDVGKYTSQPTIPGSL
jgi:hypothetical protein